MGAASARPTYPTIPHIFPHCSGGCAQPQDSPRMKGSGSRPGRSVGGKPSARVRARVRIRNEVSCTWDVQADSWYPLAIEFAKMCCQFGALFAKTVVPHQTLLWKNKFAPLLKRLLFGAPFGSLYCSPCA